MVDELEPGVSNIVIFEPTSPKIPFENGTCTSIKSPISLSVESLIVSNIAYSFEIIESKEVFKIPSTFLPNESFIFNPS